MTTEQPSPPEDFLTEPGMGESVAELFWRTDRRRTLSENMSLNAILMRWRTGGIDGVTALQAMIAHDVCDYDRMLGAYADIMAKGEG